MVDANVEIYLIYGKTVCRVRKKEYMQCKQWRVLSLINFQSLRIYTRNTVFQFFHSLLVLRKPSGCFFQTEYLQKVENQGSVPVSEMCLWLVSFELYEETWSKLIKPRFCVNPKNKLHQLTVLKDDQLTVLEDDQIFETYPWDSQNSDFSFFIIKLFLIVYFLK